MPRLRVAAPSKPAAIQARRATAAAAKASDEGGRGPPELVVADREQRPEEQLVDPAARFEDVAGEDDADRERDHQEECRRRVVGDPAPPREPLEQRGESTTDAERGEGGGDARGSRQDQPGKRGRADAVSEEGQVAEDDLRAEQTGQRREQEDLERSTLHEGELEGIEHGFVDAPRVRG